MGFEQHPQIPGKLGDTLNEESLELPKIPGKLGDTLNEESLEPSQIPSKLGTPLHEGSLEPSQIPSKLDATLDEESLEPPQIPGKLDATLDEESLEPPRIPRILGIPLYEGSLEQLVENLIQVALTDKNGSHSEGVNGKQKRNRCVSAADAHVLVQAHKDPEYKKLLNQFYLNLPDGMPIVWLARRKGFNNMERCYGPDLFELMMKESANTALTHFLCGGKEGVAEELTMVCKNKFGNRNIVGSYCPPFRQMGEEEMRTLGEIIRASGADVVWIGLGAPKQEKFAAALSAYTDCAFLFTVGAAFDFYTNRQHQAPRWMQRNGFEWLFRLAMEPRRLGKRYAEVIPKFIWLNILSLIEKD